MLVRVAVVCEITLNVPRTSMAPSVNGEIIKRLKPQMSTFEMWSVSSLGLTPLRISQLDRMPAWRTYDKGPNFMGMVGKV